MHSTCIGQFHRSTISSGARYLWRNASYYPQGRFLSSPVKSHRDIKAMLSTPSWSVKSLLPNPNSTPQTQIVTPSQLHHLLRLSALPLPTTPEEEAKMLKTLESQLHFVRKIQEVNTGSVEPLQSIRDETQKGEKLLEIGVRTLKAEFAKEEVVGKRGRIRKKVGLEKVDTRGDDENKWDVLGQAGQKSGRYFVVETDKD